MKKLGLDLGSASCGWAIREDDEIVKKGVITFSTGMVKGQGGYSSPTKDRREARSKRRLIQARKYRKWALLEILIQNQMVPLALSELQAWSNYTKGYQRRFPESNSFLKWLACDFIDEGSFKYQNPYEIRAKGLDEKLSKFEFGRALYHIVQRRGYKDIGEQDKETKTQIERRKDGGFAKSMHENRTIGEALLKDFLGKNKRARNEYPYRDEYEHELELLCKKQGLSIEKTEKGNYKNELVKSLWKAIIWQRPLRSQKDKIGKCRLEPHSPRIPLSHPLFELFRALQYINTIKTVDENGKKTGLSKENREDLLNEVFFKRDKNFPFSIIKTRLDKIFGQKMTYNYLNKRTGKYDSTVSGMPVCKKFIDLFGEDIDMKQQIINLHKSALNCEVPKVMGGYSIHDIWHILIEFSDFEHLSDFAEKKLDLKSTKNKNGEVENKFANAKKVFIKGYSDVSAKAIKKIIPFLFEGYLYNEAVLLAKMPELLGDNWKNKKVIIDQITKESSKEYAFKSEIVDITNGLINAYKGLGKNEEAGYNERFADKDFKYQLDNSDILEIDKACEKYYGEKTWEKNLNKAKISEGVSDEYQLFFQDEKREYRTKPTHTYLFNKSLAEQGLHLSGELYHHSNRKNLYLDKLASDKDGKVILPTYKNTGINILPTPLIDSIKNPMFNKTMSILRKLINELIVTGEIDENTEIIVELARELNDNNKRAAIESFQNEKKRNREKYREFILEFNSKENRALNVEDRIDDFELWTEQIFEKPNDEKKHKLKRDEILAEKKAIDRYDLWTEQRGQCMYTGKTISVAQLFSAEIQIEHTIPRSKLPDNTKANKTVCFSNYNSDIKNNRIPFECPNYEVDDNNGTAIRPRLSHWEKILDRYQGLYDKNKKPNGNEDEAAKNKRITNKHYYRMHLDYWKDKVGRFTTDEIKEGWVRRQLTDTQMVSKYTREFLKTYFKKVNVEKGLITAEFRKIYGFQSEDEIKTRNKHTHHAIDAAVLTLIPTNASRKKAILKKSFFFEETKGGKQFTTKPYTGFNAQELIREIENETLIYNYTKDNIISSTYKKVRKRGVVQMDKNGKQLWMKGDSIRGDLYGQTFLAKIKDVELDENSRPKRDEEGNWMFKKDKAGYHEYSFGTKKPIEEVKAKYIKDIIDPDIRELVDKQKDNDEVFDHHGKKIRRVRIKTKKGREVKKRISFKSQQEHKNYYYASAGEIPYAIMLENMVKGKMERKMIPVAIHEVAKTFKKHKKFTADFYLEMFHPTLVGKFGNQRVLRVGQKVLVLQNDNELEEVTDVSFQRNRLYKIKKFDGNIWLKYHLEAMHDDNIDMAVKKRKDEIMRVYEIKLDIPEFMPHTEEKKNDFTKRKYAFDNLARDRFQRLLPFSSIEELKVLKSKMDMYKKQSSKIEELPPSLLKMNRPDSWNFLYEGVDFEMDILGNLNVHIENLTV